MKTSHWPRARTPPRRPQRRIAEEQEQQRGDLAGARRAEAPAEREEQQRRRDRDRRGRRPARPARRARSPTARRRSQWMPGRLLIPGVAIRQLAVQDALADVAVERLIGAGRLLQRRQAQRDAEREQRPEDPAREPGVHGSRGARMAGTALVGGGGDPRRGRSLPAAAASCRRSAAARSRRRRATWW